MVDEESSISRMADNGERRYNEAIMDLGCTATVAGRTWVEEFIQGSGAEIQRYSTEPLDFAGFTAEVTRSSEAAILHIIILGRYTKMLVHVVDADTTAVVQAKYG